MRHIKSLDGLRGLAAYAVVFAHFSDVSKAYQTVLGGGLGQLGVMIFFALSGFLMAHISFAQDIHFGSVKTFYKRRFSRVYPLFFFVVLFFFFIYAFFGNSSLRNAFVIYNMDVTLTLKHLFLIKGVGPMWTIPVEIMFYIIFPLFWWLYKKTGVMGFVLSAAVIFFILQITGYKNFVPGHGTLLGTIHVFLFGIIIWLLYDRTQRTPLLDKIANFGFVISSILVLILVPYIFKQVFGRPTGLWTEPAAFLGISMIIYFASTSSWAERALGAKIPSFFGNISYSVYLWHIPVLHYTARHLVNKENTLLYLSVSLLLITLVGYLSYKLIEVPSRRWINNLNQKKRDARKI